MVAVILVEVTAAWDTTRTMTVSFTKMHGLGNDFILIDAVSQPLRISHPSQWAKTLCDRRHGVGADGLIIIRPSDVADADMTIINSDGSEPEMCGNGIRCAAKFMHDIGMISTQSLTINTAAGIMSLTLNISEDHHNEDTIQVDMGPPILQRSRIPVGGTDSDTVIQEPITVEGHTLYVTAVSMGNPHAVIFVEVLGSVDFNALGPALESHSRFPNRINVEFTEIISTTECRVKVWERGAGPTLACGTGACAVVVAGVLNNVLDRKSTVHLPGGALAIEWNEVSNRVMMTGPAVTVFSGCTTLE